MPVTFTDPKDAQRWENVRQLLDDRRSVFARRGSVVATYRRYRGRRLGPYYALIFREEGHRRDPQRTVYLGGNAELADAVRRVLTKTQAPRNQIRDERRAQRRRIAQTEAQLRTIDRTLAAVAKTLARAEQKCSHRRQTVGGASHAETQLPHALASVATERAEQNPDSRFPTPESPRRAEQNPNPPIRQKFREVLNKNRHRRWEAQRLRSELAKEAVLNKTASRPGQLPQRPGQLPSRSEVGQRPPC